MAFRVCVGGLLAAWCVIAGAQDLPLIDVHVHFQPVPGGLPAGAVQGAVDSMNRLGIERSLLMPPPQVDTAQKGFHDLSDLQRAARPHADRFAFLGGSALNAMLHQTPVPAVDDAVRARFRQQALDYVQQGAVGFGEIALLHLSLPAMGAGHRYESVPGDHPLLLLLADLSAELQRPVDLHVDLVPEDMPLPDALRANAANPDLLPANAEAFKRLLAHNPKAVIVWSHVGFDPLLTRHPTRVRQMLQSFPKLHMSFRLNRGAPRPGAALESDGRLKPQWLALISEFPDRFMLGSDAFYGPGGSERGATEEGMLNLQRLIAQLPPDVARQVARDNAIRVYRLRP